MNNFDFLKPIDKNLHEIISEAELLYRDEYFEQCITQTRRFGEIVCKNVLDNNRTTEKTFDDMLATLKDKISGSIQEKEFVEDLYFLKREGNSSVHASTVKKDGIIALECLQRAFEVAINYSVYYKKSNSNLLKYQYDTELLITGKKSKKSLAEKYVEEKAKTTPEKGPKRKTSKKVTKHSSKRFSFYWIFILISLMVSVVLTLTIFLLSIT